MLYDLVRRNADKVVELYREYWRNRKLISSVDLDDERTRVEARNKVQEVRARLVEMAGEKVVNDLDERFSASVERADLLKLWTSVCERSPDIQFVIGKCSTSKQDQAMREKALTRVIGEPAVLRTSPEIFLSYVYPPPPELFAETAFFRDYIAKNSLPKLEGLSQTEAIMLFDFVRRHADRLVELYRTYKRDLRNLASALAEADEKTRAELTLKLQKDRSSLVELAGEEAVTRLDKGSD